MATLRLEVDHYPGQVFRPDLMAYALVTNVVVLTETASQIAVSKEDGSGTVPADEGIFFSEMRAVTGNKGPSAGSAKPFLSL